MNNEKYYNNITKDIDISRGISENKPHYCKSYIMFHHPDVYCIRVPGCTIGYIKVDNDMIIKELEIYDKLKIVTFKNDINEKLGFYIGTKLEGLE